MRGFVWGAFFVAGMGWADCGSWTLPPLEREPQERVFAAPPAQVGDRLTFFVHIPEGRVRATLRHVGKYAAYWVDEAKGDVVADAALRLLSDEFDRFIYPSVRRWFGWEPFPGVDGDGRLTVLFHDVESNNGAAGFGGYFSPADQIPRLPNSNAREMLYLDVYALRDYDRFRFFNLVAHELTHLVNWNQRGSDERWLEEGRAAFAEWALYGNVHVDFVEAYLADTSVSLAAQNDFATWYGGGFLWVLYLHDLLGRAFVEAFSREPGRGLRAVEGTLSRLRRTETLEDLLRGFALANLLNDRSAHPLGGYRNLRPEFRARKVRRWGGIPFRESLELGEGSSVYVEVSNLSENLSVQVEGERVVTSLWRPRTRELLPVRRGEDGTFRRTLRGVGGESLTLLVTALQPQSLTLAVTPEPLPDGFLPGGALTTPLPSPFSFESRALSRRVVEGTLEEEAFFPFGGEAYGLSVRGGDLWTTVGWGVLRFDRSDPAQPRLVDVVPTNGFAQDVLAAEDYVAVAQGRGGLLVLDPQTGQRRASVSSGGNAVRLARYGVWLFVLNADTGLRLFDLSDPGSPRLRAQFFGGAGVDVAVVGDRLFLSDASGLSLYGLEGLPVLRRVGEGRFSAQGIALEGGRLWVGSGSLRAYNVNDLAAKPLATLPTVGEPLALLLQKGILTVAEGEGGLSTVSVEGVPRMLARLSLPGEPNALAGEEGWVYVACGSSVSAVDVREPSRPKVTWTMHFGGTGGRLRTAERRIAVALGRGGAILLEGGDVAQVAVRSRLETRSLALVAALSGDRCVVGTTEGIEVWDVRGEPHFLFASATGAPVLDVALSGEVVYAASGGVWAFEVATGRLLGRWEGTEWASALSLRGNRLAVGALEDGVFVLDVSEVNRLVERERFATPGSARAVFYEEGRLYVGAGGTILVFGEEGELLRWEAGFDVRHLVAKGGFVFAGGETNLAAWDARGAQTLLSRVRGLEGVGGLGVTGSRVVVSDRLGVRFYRRSDAGVPLAVTGTEPDSGESPWHFEERLGPNYPNPFNVETWIPFELGEGSWVELFVYDAQGCAVRRWVLGWREAGRGVVRWDGRNDRGEPVGSGVYFVELRVKERRWVRRLVVRR